MKTCKECGEEKEVDWVGWCDDCNENLREEVEINEKEGRSAYGLEGWDE